MEIKEHKDKKIIENAIEGENNKIKVSREVATKIIIEPI